MNPIKNSPVFSFIAGVLLSGNIFGQTDTSKINIGVSLPQLVSGTPELLVDYFFSRAFGVSLHAGYNYKTVTGFIKVGDPVDIEKQHGAYFKLGLKVRIHTKRPWVTPFVQLFYVGSFYTESGTRVNQDNSGISRIPVKASGFANGAAIVTGVDFRICSRLGIKTALQFGTYKRTDHLKYPANTFQPGLGVEGPFLTNQLIAGLVLKL